MSAIDWDDAYANGKYIKDAESYPPLWAAAAAEFCHALTDAGRVELNIPYGTHLREKLDLFLPDSAPKGLMVFVHGGYWKAFDKSDWSHLAAGALARGFAVAVPSYVLCPEARISDITLSIAKAIETAADRIAGPIHLAGHSAGGHLVCRMLCNDLSWNSCFPARIKRVVSISGLHDLRPLLNTEMKGELRLYAAEATSESPLLHKDIKPIPVTAWVGGDERPVFVDQSRWLARDWPNAEVHIAPGRHHFDVIDDLSDKDSPLIMALLDQ